MVATARARRPAAGTKDKMHNQRQGPAILNLEVSRQGDASGVEAQVERLGPLVLFERHLKQFVHERSLERVRADGFEHFTLQLILQGRLRAMVADGAHEAGPGQVVLFDMRQPLRTEAEDAHLLTFAVARDLVDSAVPRPSLLHGAVLSGPAAVLLADLMLSFVRHRTAEHPELAGGATRMFREALAMALQAAAPASTRGSDDGVARVQLLIESALGDRHLCPAWVAKQAGISRSRLYELFKPAGGVSNYIQYRRALRLRSLLAGGPSAVRSVAQLAFEAGFASESHASRVYRRHFKEAPGRHRRCTELVPQVASQPGPQHWSAGLATEADPAG